jgi:hypothetical protein
MDIQAGMLLQGCPYEVCRGCETLVGQGADLISAAAASALARVALFCILLLPHALSGDWHSLRALPGLLLGCERQIADALHGGFSVAGTSRHHSTRWAGRS